MTMRLGEVKGLAALAPLRALTVLRLAVSVLDVGPAPCSREPWAELPALKHKSCSVNQEQVEEPLLLTSASIINWLLAGLCSSPVHARRCSLNILLCCRDAPEGSLLQHRHHSDNTPGRTSPRRYTPTADRTAVGPKADDWP